MVVNELEENILKFAIEDINKFVDDEDAELAIAHLAFLSTRENSHKINITEDLLRKFAPTILGKFLVGELDLFGSDVTSHSQNQCIFGYAPAEQEVQFEYKDGELVASCDIVVSKLYATDFYSLFLKDNFRNASVEMTTSTPVELPDGSLDIEWFNVHGCTVLGKPVNGSCPDANVTMVRFSEEEADEYYCIRLNKEKMVEPESKTYKINKDELKDSPWGNVDKTALRNKIMGAKNRNALVRAVYALVESGWEEAPSEYLKYPLMQETDGTFYYNRYALASALAYAKQEEEQSVISKVNSLYKKFNLNDESDKKEETTKMEDLKKLAEQKADDNAENTKDEKMACKENMAEQAAAEAKCAEGEASQGEVQCAECGPAKMSEDTAFEKFADVVAENKALMAKLEEKDKLIADQESELEELRKFSEEVKEKEKTSIVNFTLSKIKGKIDEESYKKYEESGKECKFEDVQAWKNGVLAEFAANMLKFSEESETEENKENFIRMELPKDEKLTKKSIWDNL